MQLATVASLYTTFIHCILFILFFSFFYSFITVDKHEPKYNNTQSYVQRISRINEQFATNIIIIINKLSSAFFLTVHWAILC